MTGAYPKRDRIITDGQKLTLGRETITLVFTPGHTPGTVSMLIPVTDHGQAHTAVLWGGTAFNRQLALAEMYPQSAERLLKYAEAAKADVVFTNHPGISDGLEKLAALRNRKPDGVNPFVVGEDGVQRFLGVVRECSVVWVDRLQAQQNQQPE